MTSVNPFLEIANDGQEIRATNYFESEYARRGACYVSVNAGAFRLLVPPMHESAITELRTTREVVVSRGAWPAAGRDDAFEILFDDDTDSPFCLHFGAEQIDRFPLAEDVAGKWFFSAWIRGNNNPVCAFRAPCYYRVVARLPCLEPRS
jgi:hypothetical protein